ncbi:MAG: hypothetical protein KA314_02460 [Chloroflexi bacterium]|nr:hypothetical protein [Chloroflexota bacterium]MBP8054671.1 hypothetical protein [Chloroflexota bacterium]
MKRSLRFGLGLAIITLPLLLTLYTFRFSLLPQVLFVPLPGTSSETLFALGNSQTTPTVSFSDPTYTVVENAGSRSINVTLNISSTQTVQISYQTQDESAQAGTDYYATSGVLVFTSGDRSETFAVSIINNNENTGPRTLRLILSNPVNATLGSNINVPLTITDDDPTRTPTAVVSTPIYVDAYEPNNQLSSAYNISTGSSLCANSLWPVGDHDYFRFFAKGGYSYELFTHDLSLGLDTYLILYNTQGGIMAENDDDPSNTSHPKASRILFTPGSDGYYYARVHNLDPSDPANKSYCLEVEETVVPTPTFGPTPTAVGSSDSCEYNGDRGSACLMGIGQNKTAMNFVPIYGEGPDNDFYRMWVLGGVYYTCFTDNLSAVNDTNMILYDHNGNLIAGNNDETLGNPASKVIFLSSYTGWLYVLVGPVVPIIYEESAAYTYDVGCTATVATPTPTPTVTGTPTVRPPTGGGGPAVPTATPLIFPTFPPSPTPITFPTPPTETPRPVVQFSPLPTATPVGAGQGQTIVLDVTLYYDSNNNFTPELTEGIMGAAVAVYDGSTGVLLVFGYTNEAGTIRFSQLTATGPVRVTVPFFSFNQVVSGNAGEVRVRVAPNSLPIGIP